jgi:NAD(P)-dependent dehydrogenase (short-subunit alcohol dehydrogenase family)
MLKDKISIVTGAAKGIGRGIALALAKNGSKVVLSDLDTKENEKAAKEIEKETGSPCIAVTCDVSKKEQVDALVDAAVKKFGKLDILVNNAGIYPFKPFMELTEADWDKVINVNLKSVFMCSQAAAKAMKNGGKIVSISSIAAFVGFEGLTHYCATKGGINGFTRALALELASKKINVNAVAPGSIDTPGSGVVSMDEAARQQMNNSIPWKRMGTPDDIAQAVVYLASPGADYVTGQVLIVDGGYVLR